jgi:aspartate racemase
MKTIGMIGGMSWESTSVYYQLLNREIQKRVGGVHSAKCLMYSVDFGEIEPLQSSGRWDEATRQMEDIGRALVKGGADFLMICCNTMHLMADEVEKAAGVPLLHIADPLGEAIKRDGFQTVGLIGTRYTMEEGGVISDRLARKFGLEVLTPDENDRAALQRIIYEELCRGDFNDASRAACAAIMEKVVRRGAQGVILGCTEFPILLKAEHASVPLYDTATLHALAAVGLALA